MPRFYFDFTDQDGLFVDTEGTDLPDPQAAEREATRALTEMAGDWLPDTNSGRLSIFIRDEADRGVLVVSLTLVVERASE